MSEPDAYSVSIGNRIGRRAVRAAAGVLYRLLARTRISGLENVPGDGAYIIAFNHISIYEPPFILTFWPVAPEVLGAVEVWRERDKKWLAHLYGGIQLDRDQISREPLEKALLALRSGYAVMMSPEGRISRQPGLRRAKWGIAYLVEKARVPVVPIGITGSTGDFLKQALAFKQPRLEMRIGKPFRLPPLESLTTGRREALQQNADTVMLRIAELLPPEYRGVYHEQSQCL